MIIMFHSALDHFNRMWLPKDLIIWSAGRGGDGRIKLGDLPLREYYMNKEQDKRPQKQTTNLFIKAVT